ncbi:MAG: phage tail sheath family protein [Flavobacteriales bacterium]|nr:phage tail sheath family protein [Flavobacteriales bacterium]
MAQYKTPGVYVKEENSFGSSIVANETAVPVFIGFTEKMTNRIGETLPTIKGSKNIYVPVMVRSVLEYAESFGGPDKTGTMKVTQEGTEQKPYYISKITKGPGEKLYTPGFMQPSIANYFANGGGMCYIISLGDYNLFNRSKAGTQVNMELIQKALNEAEQSTLILPTDLIRYGDANYYNWCNQFIAYSEETKRQFCVLDVVMNDPMSSILNEEDSEKYRTNITADPLKFAAAYYPYLKSLTPYAYNDTDVYFENTPLAQYSKNGYGYEGVLDNGGTILIKSTYLTMEEAEKPLIKIDKNGTDEISIEVAGNGFIIKIKSTGETTKEALTKKWNDVTNKKGYTLGFNENFAASSEAADLTFIESNSWISNEEVKPFIIKRIAGLSSATTKVDVKFVEGAFKMTEDVSLASLTIDCVLNNSPEVIYAEINSYLNSTVEEIEKLTEFETPPAAEDEYIRRQKIKDAYTFSLNSKWENLNVNNSNTELIKVIVPDNAKIEDVKSYLAANYIHLPASPFMAGIYSRMDNASGVWTPPANVSPTGVTGPVVNLTADQQQDFNVSASTGKSINAIRSFTKRGTLVWGARTNDGNSLDWRYINVKRLFIAIETDIRMALEAYVFKPNVHNTWVEVKTMIDSYLFGLFNNGAFAGETPETSYKVLIGLGETMTEQDVLDGLMKASIQVAPVRPAEFIELTFSQLVAQ